MKPGRPRIMVVNPFGIGDVLFSTPLVHAVRRAFPTSYLAYLCNRRTEQILRRNGDVDELFIYEKDELVGLWRQGKRRGSAALIALLATIRQQRFDLALDLSLGERYSFVLALLGVPRRIGFDFRRRGRFLTHRMAMDGYRDRHVVEYYVDLLEGLGIRLVDRQMTLHADDDPTDALSQRLDALRHHGRRVIGVVPAGGISWGIQANFRRWSKDGFIAVARALSQRRDVAIVLFGEPNDHAVCAEIAQAVGHEAMDLSGQTSLAQFVRLVARCDLVIANDGGPVHIAASQGVRTVSVFGPVDPEVYGPYPRGERHRVVYKEDLPCRPCYHRFRLPPCPYGRACLSDLQPEDVLAACEESLAGAEQERAGGIASAS